MRLQVFLVLLQFSPLATVSSRSPYFKNLLEQNPAKHPIIILKDVPFAHLTAILEFMYAGEVNVAQVRLSFLS